MERFRALMSSAACVLLAACQGDAPPQRVDPPARVRTLAVAEEAVEVTITATGALEPAARVLVAAQQEGLVTAVRAREGDRVAAGAVLVELDDREIQAQLAEAEARQAETEAGWRRVAALAGEGLVSSAEVDASRAALDTAAARAELLRTRLSFTRVTAPVSGVVTVRRVEVGNSVAAREPLLELAAGDGLVLRVPVSELDVVRLAAGDAAVVTVDALPELRIPSHIARIFPAAEATSRQVTVELQLDQVPQGVRLGFLARARLVTARISDALMVPEPAVQRGSDGRFFVYLADQGRASVQAVEVAERLDGRVRVTLGLSPGDEVVVEGLARLGDGVPIVTGAGSGS